MQQRVKQVSFTLLLSKMNVILARIEQATLAPNKYRQQVGHRANPRIFICLMLQSCASVVKQTSRVPETTLER